jgi:acyl-CoA thioesterase FadM
VLARVAIDYRRELRLADEAAVVACRLERLGTSSVATREEIRVSDELAAEAEAVLVPRGSDGRSRPLSEAERAALEGAA